MELIRACARLMPDKAIAGMAFPSWDFEDEAEQSVSRPCRQCDGRSKQTYELTLSIVPQGTSFHRSVELGFLLSGSCRGLLLNRTGKRTGRLNGWTQSRVRGFRNTHGITVYRDGEWAERGEVTLPEAARTLNLEPPDKRSTSPRATSTSH